MIVFKINSTHCSDYLGNSAFDLRSIEYDLAMLFKNIFGFIVSINFEMIDMELATR